MSEADTSGAEPLRYPIPHGLQRRSAWLAKWMRIVGMFQAGVAGLAFLYLGVASIAAVFTLGIFSASNIVMLLLLAALGILFRQALCYWRPRTISATSAASPRTRTIISTSRLRGCVQYL